MAFSEYSKPPIKVLAEQIEGEPRSVITPNGAVTGNPGEWEVRFEDGNVTKMTDEEFQADFGGEEKDDNGAPDEPENESPTAEREDTIGDEKAESDGETHRPTPPPPPTRRR